MPEVAITDGDHSFKIVDDDATVKQLFILASDAMDHRTQTGVWMPHAMRLELANKTTTNN